MSEVFRRDGGAALVDQGDVVRGDEGVVFEFVLVEVDLFAAVVAGEG